MDSGPVCPFAGGPLRAVRRWLPRRVAGLALMLSYKLMHPLVRKFGQRLPTWGVIKSLRRVSLTLIRNRTKIPCIVNPWASRWVVDRVGRRLAGARLLGVGQRVCLRLAGRRCVSAWSGTNMPAYGFRACERIPACGTEQAQPDARRLVDVWKTARGGLCHGR